VISHRVAPWQILSLHNYCGEYWIFPLNACNKTGDNGKQALKIIFTLGCQIFIPSFPFNKMNFKAGAFIPAA